METVTCNVSDLDARDRSSFERVLGRSLAESQQLKIEVVDQQVRRPRPPITGIPTIGQYEGRLVVPDSFDEPLEEMREYME
jgi:hypothetical protein